MVIKEDALKEPTGLISEDNMDQESIRQAITNLLTAVGENPEREGLRRTPDRVARMYGELLEGYRQDPHALVNDALFEVKYDEMVLVHDIEFYSLCEHHMLPFLGVDMFARRLQVQERMTRQIAECIDELLNPLGVAVVIEGLHLCATMRGVKKHDARMTTSAMLGAFRKSLATREEFLANIARGSNPIL